MDFVLLVHISQAPPIVMLAGMLCGAVLLVSTMGITTGNTTFGELLEGCPRYFHVPRHPMDEKPIIVIAKYGKKYCSHIPTDSFDIKEEKDLSPKMDLTARNVNYSVNISWTVSGLQRTHYPKKFILHLKLLQEDVSSKYEEYEDTCVILNLRERKVGHEIKTVFHLDCIPVITEPNILMSAQIWSLPDGSQSGPCRHRRSLPNTCSTAKCSRRNYIRLSLDGNELELCAKNEAIPVLKWEQLSTGYFLVNFTNLRPYLSHVYVTIKNGVNTFEEKHLRRKDIHSRSINIKSEKQPTLPGVYSVHFYSDCISVEEREDMSSRIVTSWREWDYSRQNITVVPKEDIRRPASNIETILVVSLIVGAIATVVLTFTLSHRQKSHSSEHIIPLSDISVSNRNQSGETPGVPDENVKLITVEYKQNPNEDGEESVHGKVCKCFTSEAAGPINDSISMDNKKETFPSALAGTSYDGCYGDCFSGQCKLKMSTSAAKYNSKLNSCSVDCLLLFQPDYDNMELTNSLSVFFEIIDQTTNVRLIKGSGPRESWTDFGKSAAKRFPHIIIIVTKSFCDLCTLLKDHEYSDYLEALLKERNFEEVPVMVLDSIQTSVKEKRDSNTTLHLVSLDACIERGQSVVEQFLSSYNFIYNTKHYIYYISDILNHAKSQEFSENLTILTKRLATPLR